MERITQRTSADQPASSLPDRQRPGPRTAPIEHPEGVDSVVTLRVGHPLRLVEAIVMQQKVWALIARRPDVIVLDVAGILPMDDMGVLMLPNVALDAAHEGVVVALANLSPPLRDRLAQLGVRNLTFIDSPVPTRAAVAPGTTRLTGAGLPPDLAGADSHGEGLAISLRPLGSTS